MKIILGLLACTCLPVDKLDPGIRHLSLKKKIEKDYGSPYPRIKHGQASTGKLGQSDIQSKT